MTKASSSVSETRSTAFDLLGKILSSQQTTDGQTYSSAYVYDLSEALIEQTYTSDRKIAIFLNDNFVKQLDGVSEMVISDCANSRRSIKMAKFNN